MKIDNIISSDIIKKIETNNDSLGVLKEDKEKENKEVSGDSVELSLEGLQRVREDEIIENPTLSSLSFKKDDNGNSIIEVRDKKTNEIIRQIPTEEAIKNYERINNFLNRVAIDLIV